MEVETTGSISAEDAVAYSAWNLSRSIKNVCNFDEPVEAPIKEVLLNQSLTKFIKKS